MASPNSNSSNDIEMEPLRLLCDDCGEAFDSMQTAATHDSECGDPAEFSLFRILPESEAM